MAFLLIVSARDLWAATNHQVDSQVFAAWRQLVPELPGALLCSLTPAGHDLWEEGQLRIPTGRFFHGDVNQDGREEWAIDLQAGEGSPCDAVLVVSETNEGWQRLIFRRIPLNRSEQIAGFLWNKERQAIGVDLNKRRRETAPATMSWPDGKSQAGYVIEYAIIQHIITWRDASKQFDYQVVAPPEEWDTWRIRQ